MKHNLLLYLSLLLPTLLPAQEDTTVFRHNKLGNGLTYYVRHTSLQKGKADFYLVQNVGAMMEEENQNGLAHFLEHMAFNGTENFPKGIQTFLKRRGITQFNAYTGQDETVYHINGVPTQSQGLVDSCLLIMRDWSGFLLLDPVEIDKERGVILEEKRLRQNVVSRMQEQTSRYLYNNSKYATHNTIGLEEVIKNFVPDELHAYYNDYYRPDQQAVIVVGDIDVQAVEKELIRLFNPIPKRETPKPRLVYEIPDNEEPIYAKAFDKELPGTSLLLTKRYRLVPPASLEEMMRNNLLRKFYSDIVRKHLSAYIDDESPDFMQTMVSVRKLVRNYEALNIMVTPYPGKDREALREVLTELERIYRFAFTPQELQEQISSYLEGLNETEQMQEHLSNDVYVQLYQNNFLEGNPVTTIAEDIALSRKILATLNIKDMQQWMTRFDNNRNWVFIMQGNNPDYDFPSKEEIVSMMQEIHTGELQPRNTSIVARPLIDFDIQGGHIVKNKKIDKFKAEKWVLSNGCTVYFKQVSIDKGRISLTGNSPGGQSLLPAEDLPSAAALGDLILASGIYHHNARMFREIMKDCKATVNFRLGEVSEDIRSGCDSADVETMFQLVYLLFEKPRFDRGDFEKFIFESKVQSESTPVSPMDSVSEVVQNLRQIDSPRRWKEDKHFLEAMDFDKMVAIYKDRFRDASDFTFYLTGDINRVEAMKLVELYLGAIPSIYRKEKPVEYDFLRKGSFKEDITADIPGHKYMVNIEFHNYLSLKPIEKLSMNLVQKILQDRYMAEIREEHGGAYGIKVALSLTNKPHPHEFVGINFQSSLDKGDLMRSLVHQQILSVIQQGVEEEEVEDLLLLLGKSLASDPRPNNFYWTNVLHTYATTGRDISGPDTETPKLMKKINIRDVQATARKFFSTADCFDIVIKSKD